MVDIYRCSRSSMDHTERISHHRWSRSWRLVLHIMRSQAGVKAPEEVELSAAARLQSLRALDGAWRVACTRARRSHRLESHRGPSTTGGVARDSGSVRGQRTAAEHGTVCFLTPLSTVHWKVQQVRRLTRGNCLVRPRTTRRYDSAACVT